MLLKTDVELTFDDTPSAKSVNASCRALAIYCADVPIFLTDAIPT